MAANPKVKERMFKLVKELRKQRLRGLKTTAVEEQKQTAATNDAPPAEDVAALEAMLGSE